MSSTMSATIIAMRNERHPRMNRAVFAKFCIRFSKTAIFLKSVSPGYLRIAPKCIQGNGEVLWWANQELAQNSGFEERLRDMTNYLTLPIGDRVPESVNAVVEIPFEGINKYE